MFNFSRTVRAWRRPNAGAAQRIDAQGRALGAVLRERERDELAPEVAQRLAASRQMAVAHARAKWAQAQATQAHSPALACADRGWARRLALMAGGLALAAVALHQRSAPEPDAAWAQELQYHITAEEAQD